MYIILQSRNEAILTLVKINLTKVPCVMILNKQPMSHFSSLTDMS